MVVSAARGLLAAGLVIRMRTDGRIGFPIVWMGLVLVASFALILPFVFNFSPESSGIGVVAGSCEPVTACAPRRSFKYWLGDMALIYGILLWPLIGLFAQRLLSSPKRWLWLGWGGAAVVVAGRCWRPRT